MPKPTIIQALLGRPSQHYSFPAEKNYYYTKHDLIRAATEDRHGSEAGPSHRHSSASPTPASPSQPRSPTAREQPERRRSPKRRRTLTTPLVGPEDASEYFVSRSVIQQIASTEASSQKQKADPYHAVPSSPYISPAGYPGSSARRPVDLTVGPPDDTRDDDYEVFYTPSSSLVPSPQELTAAEAMLFEPQALATALLPIHGRPKLKSSIAPPTLSRDSSFDLDFALTPGPLTRTSSEVEPPPSAVVSRSSSDSSLSSSSALSASPPVSDQDAVSLFDSGATTSTRITTPLGSVGQPKSDEGHDEAITILSSSRKARPLSIDLSPASLQPRPSVRHDRRASHPTSPLRSDEDWAKDVRWLVPSGPAPTAPSRTKPLQNADSPVRIARPLHPDLLPPLPTDAMPIPAPHQLERQAFPDLTSVAGTATARPRPKEQRNSRHSSSRHSKTRMSALWEEDESEYSDWGASSADVSRASTPAPTPFADGYMGERAGTSTPPIGWGYAGIGSMSGPVVTSGVGAVGHGPLHPEFRNSLHRRPSMSESNLLDRFKHDPEPPSPTESPDVRFQDYARRRRNHLRSVSLSNPSAPSLGQQVTLSSSLPTHSIPAPFPISEPGHGSGSVGYTSLTLPHAAYTGKSGKTRLDGQVDLVRSGKAQSSMATVEIVRGVAASVGSSPLSKTRRRLSFSVGIGKNGRRREKESETPAHLRATLPLPVAFTAHIPPAELRVDGPHPGANLRGRLGWHRLIDRAGEGGEARGSLPSPTQSGVMLPASNQLTPQDLALVPLCGLPAHRAVRSFADVIAARKSKGGRARILILNAHDGASAMALQMLAKKKVDVCAQIPESAVRDVDESEESSEGSNSGASLTRRERVETRVRGWGAGEVFVGEPLAVLEQLFEEERSFDGVLDTVGGVEIWEAAQRLLATYPSMSCAVSDVEDNADDGRKKKVFVCPAQFTTLVGDMPSRAIPSANDNIRMGLRSLRRAVSTSQAPAKGSNPNGTWGRRRAKVKRMVGYAWVSVAADVDEGEDVRDSLAAVVEMVEGNKVRPWVGADEDEDRVVTFERAPEAFRRDADGPRGVLQDAGTCVVKIGAWS
ncbi:hypothetical protein EVJ58_g4771 [Rhodofomes roseus]|uniref:Uncharacterized protein n=1 Tax=Rhodofomes roseus TaxID=34475 RepID=A0A4Y9YFP1_9APHY|nr:hypothetical protein EVJ58_g4771 [Rhodofomes roseus]